MKTHLWEHFNTFLTGLTRGSVLNLRIVHDICVNLVCRNSLKTLSSSLISFSADICLCFCCCCFQLTLKLFLPSVTLMLILCSVNSAAGSHNTLSHERNYILTKSCVLIQTYIKHFNTCNYSRRLL